MEIWENECLTGNQVSVSLGARTTSPTEWALRHAPSTPIPSSGGANIWRVRKSYQRVVLACTVLYRIQYSTAMSTGLGLWLRSADSPPCPKVCRGSRQEEACDQRGVCVQLRPRSMATRQLCNGARSWGEAPLPTQHASSQCLPSSSKSEHTPSCLSQPRLTSQAVLVGEEVWVIAGWDGGQGFLSDVWALDPIRWAWRQVQLSGEPMPQISRYGVPST